MHKNLNDELLNHCGDNAVKDSEISETKIKSLDNYIGTSEPGLD